MKTNLFLCSVYFLFFSSSCLAMEQDQKKIKTEENPKDSKVVNVPSLVNLVLQYLARHEISKKQPLLELRPALDKGYGELHAHLTIPLVHQLIEENIKSANTYNPIDILLVLAEYLMEKSIREAPDTTIQQKSYKEKVAYVEERALNCKCLQGCSLEHTALKCIDSLNQSKSLKDRGHLRPIALSALFRCPLTLVYLVNKKEHHSNPQDNLQELHQALKQLLYHQKDEEACEVLSLLPADMLAKHDSNRFNLANYAQLNKCKKALVLLFKNQKISPILGYIQTRLPMVKQYFYPNVAIQQSFSVGDSEVINEFLQLCRQPKTGPSIDIDSPMFNSFDIGDDELPLLYALEQGYLGVAELLIKEGVDIAIRDYPAQSPLHFACKQGYLEIVQLLLSKGASTLINTRLHSGIVPLHYACQNGDVSLVQFLLDNGADINVRINARPHYHSAYEYPFRSYATALHIACGEGNVPLAKLLIQRGATIDATDTFSNTPLHSACSRGYLEIVQLLLEKAQSLFDREHYLAYINAHGNSLYTPFLRACESGSNSLIKYLLTCQGCITQHKMALFLYLTSPAIGDRSLELSIVESLFPHIEDINQQDSDHLSETDETLLHKVTAILSNDEVERTKIVQFLLSKGASTTITNHKGNNPLHYECKQRANPEIVKLLLDNGAEVNAQNNKGKTPLHRYIREAPDGNMKEVILLLLAKGADINAIDKEGDTPLHYLCKYRFGDDEFNERLLEAVAFLLSHGALPTIQNKAGKTPLDIAQESNDQALIELFAKHTTQQSKV
jgi:ankyrin repeat protein